MYLSGKRKLAQHRVVNEALKVEIPTIHGLTLETFTPEQFDKQQA